MIPREDILRELSYAKVIHCELSDGTAIQIGTAPFVIGGDKLGYVSDLCKTKYVFNTPVACIDDLYAHLDTLHLEIIDYA